MNTALFVLGWIFFGGIAIEDFRSREIHVAWFVGIGLIGLLGNFLLGSRENWTLVLANLAMVTLILALVYLSFRLRKRDKFWDKYLGLGDVAMLYGLCFWLAPLGLLYVFVSTNVLTVLFLGILIGMKKINPQTFAIPLAGIWALGWMAMAIMESLKIGPQMGAMLW